MMQNISINRFEKTETPEKHIFVLKNGNKVEKSSGSFLPSHLLDDQDLYFPIQDYFSGIKGFTVVGTTMIEWKNTIKKIIDIPLINRESFIEDVNCNINKVIPHLDRIYSRISTSKHAKTKWKNFCNDVVICLAYNRIWKKVHIITFISVPHFNKFDPDGVSRNMFFHI